MSQALYNTMAPIGMMHAKEIARAVDALCMQACTHAAMAGALVARGMTPSQAVYSVMAMEGAGATIPTQMMVPPAGIAPTGIAPTVGIAPQFGMVPQYGMASAAGLASTVGISPQMAQQIAMRAAAPYSVTPGMTLSGNPAFADPGMD